MMRSLKDEVEKAQTEATNAKKKIQRLEDALNIKEDESEKISKKKFIAIYNFLFVNHYFECFSGWTNKFTTSITKRENFKSTSNLFFILRFTSKLIFMPFTNN